MRRVRIAVLALGLAACSREDLVDSPAPTDRFYFPVGLAVTSAAAAPSGKALLVTSSNFDLRYTPSDGGTLLSVDPVGSPGVGPVALLGAERIASYAGPVAVADATTCPGIAQSAVVTASRYDDTIYRFDLAPDGSLSCGAACERGVSASVQDPFGVAIACLPAGAPAREAGPRRAAYVAWLDTPDSAGGWGPGAWLTELDLDDPAGPLRTVKVGDGPIRSMAYDRDADRLWIATRSEGPRALLYSVALGDPRWRGASPWEAVDAFDLYPAVRGMELRSIAIGSPVAGAPQRLYATARLYDAEYQDANGGRPGGDLGGVLLVLDVTTGASGRPEVQVHGAPLDIGAGVGDVAVVRGATGERDVVLATVLDSGSLFIYDDVRERVARIVGRDALGQPRLGDRPMAVAVDQPAPGAPAKVYVASFGWHRVTGFELDPAVPAQELQLSYIGGLTP